MLFFLISSGIVCLCLLGIILTKNYCLKNNKKFGSTYSGPIFVVVGAIMAIVGLFFVPLLRTVKVEYKEVENCQIVKAPEAIIVDLTNANIKTWYKLVKFNSYRAVTEFGDSTKIFEANEKSFYNASMNKSYVWSNPPYKYYNRE